MKIIKVKCEDASSDIKIEIEDAISSTQGLLSSLKDNILRKYNKDGLVDQSQVKAAIRRLKAIDRNLVELQKSK